ncbi:MAG: undecaprenyl diphosphate synthase family protein, partial [Acidimicrobiales bacterium]
GAVPGAVPGADEASAEALAAWPERKGARSAERGVITRLLGPDGVVPPDAVTPDAVTSDAVTPPAGTADGGGTGAGPSLVLTLAIGYSGRGEIVAAVRRLAEAAVPAGDVDEAAIGGSLYDPAMPDPDLVVRSGDDRRISDLLLWEVAYSELVFVDDPWPAIGREQLFDAVVEYQRRDRRYGGLVASGDLP